MYEIKGEDDILKRNFPSILSEKERAKFKVVYGTFSDNFVFDEELHQAGSKLRSYKSFISYRLYFEAPILDLDCLVSNAFKHCICKISDFVNSVSLFNVNRYSNSSYSYMNDMTIYVQDVYDDFTNKIDSLARCVVSEGKCLFSSDNIDVYFKRYVDSIRAFTSVLLGVSSESVLFIVGFHISRLKDLDSICDIKVDDLRCLLDKNRFSFNVLG